MGPLGPPLSERSEPWYRSERYADGRLRFVWPGLFDSVLSADGRDVAVAPLSEESDAAFATHLFGHVLSFVLLKHGIEPLHATVLVAPDGAVGILGDSGYGKSTLAAGLAASGLQLLTDDLLVVLEAGGEMMAQPGLPRLKLWPDAAAEFRPDAPSEPLAPGATKRIYPLGLDEWTGEPQPMRVVYVLRRPVLKQNTSRVTIRKIAPSKAFVEVTRNTFNSAVDDPSRLRGHFDFASDLVTRVAFRSLTYPAGFEHMPKVIERLTRDMTRG